MIILSVLIYYTSNNKNVQYRNKNYIKKLSNYLLFFAVFMEAIKIFFKNDKKSINDEIKNFTIEINKSLSNLNHEITTSVLKNNLEISKYFFPE